MGRGTVNTPERIAAGFNSVVLFLCHLVTTSFGAVGFWGVITERLHPASLAFSIPILVTAVRAILKDQTNAK